MSVPNQPSQPPGPSNQPPQQPQSDGEPGGEGVFEGDQDDWEAADDGMKDHFLAAFMHKAGHGPHPGKGPHEFNLREPDERQEAEYDHMRAAEFGEKMPGGEVSDMGPGEFEQKQVQQTQALGQQNVLQGAAKAQMAQAAQKPVNAPIEAPGAAGESVPYPAQKGETEEPPGPGEGAA
jgi:hypothetical protein